MHFTNLCRVFYYYFGDYPTPGADPWPTEPGFQILESERVFNISSRPVLAGLRQGRFPLMEEPHDIIHFVSFLMNQHYASGIISQMAKLPQLNKYPIGFGRRWFFNLEMLITGVELPEAGKNQVCQTLRELQKITMLCLFSLCPVLIESVHLIVNVRFEYMGLFKDSTGLKAPLSADYKDRMTD